MSLLLSVAVASVSGQPDILGNLKYQTVGVAIVMLSLCGLAVFVWLIARLLALFQCSREAVSTRKPLAVGDGEEIPMEVRAVISAAVHVALRSPHRILEMHPVRNPQIQAWSLEGRREIFQSHTFR